MIKNICSISCKFCGKNVLSSESTVFLYNGILRDIEIFTCPTCWFNGYYRYRVFMYEDIMVMENFIFDDGLHVSNDYIEKTSYIGIYHKTDLYNDYKNITDIPLIDKNSVNEIHKKAKLCTVLI